MDIGSHVKECLPVEDIWSCDIMVSMKVSTIYLQAKTQRNISSAALKWLE